MRKAMRSITTTLRVALYALLAMSLAAGAGANEAKSVPALRLLLFEDQPGAMSNQQYCMLVFADRHFHAEKAVRKLGRDQERQINEGVLPEIDWNALDGILDNEDFRKIHVHPNTSPLVVEDAHAYIVSVARDKTFQNMEFLDNKSRKPYESQVKPLLQWWKSVRSRRMVATGAQDSRCAADNRAVFSY
jgi:hypothetical protein